MEQLVITMEPEGLTIPQLLLYILSIIFPMIFFVFDAFLLAATIHNRRDTFVTTFGPETTLAGTFAYLNSLFISVLMTINRVFIVVKPFNSEWFSHRRVFGYCGIMSSLVLASLLIPYFSSCFIYFRIDLLAFVSGCAPNRHPITVFQNTYAIILPWVCMVVNLGVILHLRFNRRGSYTKISKFFCPKRVSVVPFGQPSNKTTLSKMQARRDLIMMKQAISIAVYLSIYELGAFLMRLFPNAYDQLPQIVRDGYFYFRYESVPVMNFFIYYVETGSTRRMFRRFMKIKENNTDSAINQTVATVAPRALLRGRSATLSPNI
uniref:G_PROTEIN_RECEP_F1_2 domain-containing protein n=1 Tax=Caenorhabditis tropicalis TaxID=1561998 RepID=A0A1I7TRS6_9PELO